MILVEPSAKAVLETECQRWIHTMRVGWVMIRWVAAIVHDPPDSERSINAKDVSIPTSIDRDRQLQRPPATCPGRGEKLEVCGSVPRARDWESVKRCRDKTPATKKEEPKRATGRRRGLDALSRRLRGLAGREGGAS
jgi:hypothetical protein